MRTIRIKDPQTSARQPDAQATEPIQLSAPAFYIFYVYAYQH